MPKQVAAYLCQYRCGMLTVDKKRVEAHEERCLKNPARKTCMTCKHNQRMPADDEEAAYWFCFIEIEPVDGHKIVIDCAEWILKGRE